MSQESTHHPAPARPNPSTSDGHPAQLRPGPFGPIPALPDEVSEHWPETSDPEQQTGSTSARELPAAETAALRLRAWMSRPENGFDLLRVYLGVGLLVRGALFARNP